MSIRHKRAGCDISAGWFDICLDLGKLREQHRFTNDQAGIAAFFTWLRDHKVRKVHVCMEHTGGYERAFALELHKAGHYVSIVDGALARNYARTHPGKSKSDKGDARMLLELLTERNPELWTPTPEFFRILGEYVRLRQKLKSSVQSWRNRSRSPSCTERTTTISQKIADLLQAELTELEETLLKLVQENPRLKEDSDLLISIPGIAELSAAKILGEMGPVENYRSARDLASAAGVTPIEYSSGNRQVRGLPVYGNRRLRSALYSTALVAKNRNEAMGKYADKIHRNGAKSKQTVLLAVTRKQCHTVFGVLTHRRPYDPDILFAHLRKAKPEVDQPIKT